MSHSVELNIEKCAGCTACVKVCPTEAIRVVRSKAVIFDQRCIDCGAASVSALIMPIR